MYLPIWWSYLLGSSNVICFMILPGASSYLASFYYQLERVFVSSWGSFKVGRPCQDVNETGHPYILTRHAYAPLSSDFRDPPRGVWVLMEKTFDSPAEEASPNI